MNFLSVENLTKSFGERVLFSDVSFGIDQGQKVAIVAKNGSGKTTLLNCLMDTEQYDSGTIVFRKDIQVAFMEQSENLPLDKTIDEVIYDHESPKLRLIKSPTNYKREDRFSSWKYGKDQCCLMIANL